MLFYMLALLERGRALGGLHVDSSQPSLGLGPLGEWPMLGKVLNADAVGDETTFVAHLLINVAVPLGESPPLGHVDLLASRELELGATESLDGFVLVFVGCSAGHEGLTNADTGYESLGLAESSSHSSLKPISSSARQHFVDSVDVVRVDSDPDVELILAAVLHHVLVAANTGGLKSLGRELLEFIRDEMNSQRKHVNSGPLAAQIVNTDLGVGDTTVETGLGVRLVLAVAITASWPTTHRDSFKVFRQAV